MITAIEGTLAGAGADWVDVTVGGVTLRASVPHTAVEGLGKVGDQVRLFTSLQLREESLTLFGFPDEEARRAFEALIGVNGVGPRLALSVLAGMGVQPLALAIAAGDPTAFKGVHGVGTKTANRIVLELKGKLDFELAPTDLTHANSDLVDALTAIGYTVSEALSAASALPRDRSMTLEERVRYCIQRMGGG